MPFRVPVLPARYKRTALLVCVLGFGLLGLQGCTVAWRLVKYGSPDINDLEVAPRDTLLPARRPWRFVQRSEPLVLPPAADWVTDFGPVEEGESAEAFFERTHTAAVLILRNDTLVYERYFNGYSRDCVLVNFSLTKALVNTLVGQALAEGVLRSTNDPVQCYLPDFQKSNPPIRLRHLMHMTSGLNHDDYHTYGKLLGMIYAPSLDLMLRRAKRRHAPNTHFAYKSIDTQVLGTALEAALQASWAGADPRDPSPRLAASGNQDLPHQSPAVHYLQTRLWTPLGMEYPAYWQLDDRGRPRFAGGVCATAIDLLKVGRLWLKHGQWAGRQLVPAQWVRQFAKQHRSQGRWPGYSQGMWLNKAGNNAFLPNSDYSAHGFKGQIIHVDPEQQVVMVRLGEKKHHYPWGSLFARLGRLLNQDPLPLQLSGEQQQWLSGYWRNAQGKLLHLRADSAGIWLRQGRRGRERYLHHNGRYHFRNPGRKLALHVAPPNHPQAGILLHLDKSRNEQAYRRLSYSAGISVN